MCGHCEGQKEVEHSRAEGPWGWEGWEDGLQGLAEEGGLGNTVEHVRSVWVWANSDLKVTERHGKGSKQGAQ